MEKVNETPVTPQELEKYKKISAKWGADRTDEETRWMLDRGYNIPRLLEPEKFEKREWEGQTVYVKKQAAQDDTARKFSRERTTKREAGFEDGKWKEEDEE